MWVIQVCAHHRAQQVWGLASSQTRNVRETQVGENSLTGVTITSTGTLAGSHLEVKGWPGFGWPCLGFRGGELWGEGAVAHSGVFSGHNPTLLVSKRRDDATLKIGRGYRGVLS